MEAGKNISNAVVKINWMYKDLNVDNTSTGFTLSICPTAGGGPEDSFLSRSDIAF